MRNAKSPFRDFYTWYFKDWFCSGARARLSVPARAIYLDLLGLCYTEGGIVPDSAVLMSRLGIPTEYAAAMEAALEEFEVHPDDNNRLMHPRMLMEVEKLQAAHARRSNGGRARAAMVKTRQEAKQAKPEPAQADGDEDF